MPIVKRTVSPTALCRQKLPRGLKNELECVTNNTLAGVIHQLASLSQHAEDIFGELFSEANSFYGRASSLKDRIEHLSVKVTQLDSNVEEVSLIDINSRKAFKSSVTTDQQVVSRQSLSQSVLNTYRQADAPPPLQELNQFRDDGKDGLKIYTDPDYFFDLWREAIQKETREAREKRREQRKKDRKANPDLRSKVKVRQAVNTRKQQAERMRHGAEFIEPASKSSSASVRRSSTARKREQVPQKEYLPPPTDQQDMNQQYPSSMPPPPPLDTSMAPSSYPEPPIPTDNLGFAPPPPPEPMHSPPPPPMMDNFSPPMSSPPPPPMVNGEIPSPPSMPMGGNAPPPPPLAPPPPMAPPAPPAPPVLEQDTAPSGLAAALQGVSLKKSEPQEPAPVDERSNLLAAIRIGINLKKVEQKERSEALPASGGNDVASILARRIAVEFSDSEVSDSTIASDDEWD